MTDCLVKGAAAVGGTLVKGDVLLAINGQDLIYHKKMDMNLVKSLIRGPAGSEVHIKALRRLKQGTKIIDHTFEVTLIRE